MLSFPPRLFKFAVCVLFSYMSYLPLAHIYERANQVLSIYYGVAVGFYQGVCYTIGLTSLLSSGIVMLEHINPHNYCFS